MNISIKLIISFLFLTLIFSCDNEIVEIENELETSTETRTLGDSSFNPSNYCNEGDALFFSDREQFNLAYKYIDDNLDESTSLVENLFAECGSFKSSFSKMLNDEFPTFELAYKPIVADPVILALINEHNELQLGENLIAFISNTEALAFASDNIAVRDEVRELNRTNSVTSDNIPNGATRIFSDDPEKIVDDAALKLFGPFCDCDVKIEHIDCCEVLITGQCQDALWSDGDGTISWGVVPGGVVTGPSTILVNGQNSLISNFFTNEERVNGSFEFTYNFCDDINPFFPQPEVVHIVLNSHADCFIDNGDDEILTINFQDGSTCDTEDNDSGWLWASVGSTRGFSLRTVALQNREFSQIVSKRWNGSAWERSDAELYVDIDVNRRNSNPCGNIDLCTILDREDEPKECGSCDYKRAQVRVNNFLGGPPHPCLGEVARCTDDVIGNFRLTSGGTTVERAISLDFDCCQM